MRRAVIILAALSVAACAGHVPPPRVEIQKVEVPVEVKCAADPGPVPTFADTPDAIKAASDLFEEVKLLLAGRAQRDARLAEVEAANAGCRPPDPG